MSKILAIDLGTKKAGMALSDELFMMAWPLKIFYYKNLEELLIEIKKIIAENDVEKIIIGNPIRSSGNEKMSLKNIEELKFALEKELIIVELENEIYSSSLAKSFFRKDFNQDVDSVAAAIILQSYLDRNKNKHG